MRWLIETYMACVVTVLAVLALQSEPGVSVVLKTVGSGLYALALAAWLALEGESA